MNVEERVQNGVNWLDEVNPEWWTKIDLEQLELWHPCHCVLGQLFEDGNEIIYNFGASGGYHLFRRQILVPIVGDEEAFNWMVQHGFANETNTGWALIENEWIRQVKVHTEIGIIS